MTETGVARPVPLEQVVEALVEAAGRRVRRVTFLGGEPTLQRSFLPALRSARELGFDEIVIFTNGASSADRAFVDSVLALGRFEWRFSIQGANEAAHDATTGRPGSFARILTGLALLRGRGQRLTANACASALGYRSLPEFPELVRRHGIEQLHVDMIRPADAGDRSDEQLREIMPRFTDMTPCFRSMLERFEEMDPGYDVNVGNLPFCVMPEWAHRIHHDGEPTLVLGSDSPGRLTEPWSKYQHQRADKLYPAACAECAFRPACRGVAEKYLEFYGDGEFRPVPRDTASAPWAGAPTPGPGPATTGTVRRLPTREARGRAALERYLRRVGHEAIEGWRVARTRRLAGGLQAVLTVAGPVGSTVELWLTVRLEQDRPLVEADFRPGAETPTEVARPVVERLSRALRA